MTRAKLVVSLLILVVGVVIYTVPFAWFYKGAWDAAQHAASYDKSVHQVAESDRTEMLARATAYNQHLFESTKTLSDPWSGADDNDTADYQSQLIPGVMSTIEFPKLGIYLPVGHGVSDKVLSSMAGHLPGSSLPIGGSSTHTVVSAHQGGLGAPLFTRLSDAKVGDIFYLKTLGVELAYQVDSIKVVEPQDVGIVKVVADQDLATLITCTPFGINTQRLLVTGHRVMDAPSPVGTVWPKLGWKFTVMLITGWVIAGLAAWSYIRRFKRTLNDQK